MRDIAFTAVFVLLMIPSFRFPWVGVLVWAWIDYMNPHRLCYGFAKLSVPYSQIIALLTLAGMAVSSERKRFPITRETALLILFCIWITVTSITALNQQGAWIEWDRAIKIQVLILATLVVINDRKRIDGLIWVIVVSLGIFGLKGGLFTVTSGGMNRVYGPEFTFIEDNNDLALALVTTLPLMRYLQLRTGSRWIRWGLGAAMLLTTISVLGSYSRGGLLGLCAAVTMMILKSRKKILLTLIMATFVPMAIKMMPQEWHDRMQTIKTYEDDNSAKGRFNAWHFAVNLAQEHPLTGGGFRAFNAELFQKYAPDPDDYHAAHNIFFKVLGEHGVPGLALFLGLAFCTFRSASWIVKRAKRIPELIWARDLASMIQVALIAYGVGGFFLNLAYFDLPYHLLTTIVATKLMVKQHIQQMNLEEPGPEAELALEPAVAS